jgi:hypothetical protein
MKDGVTRTTALRAGEEGCQTLLMRQQRQREERERRAWKRLRKLVPEANALPLDRTAQILVARGLDT